MRLTDPIPLPKPFNDPMLRRWVLSFVLIDLFFIGLSLLGCIADPVMCGVATVFGIAFFYTVYGMFLPDLGAIDGLATVAYLAPLLGVLVHVGLGVLAWRLTKGADRPWGTTFGLGILVTLLSGPVLNMTLLSIQTDAGPHTTSPRINRSVDAEGRSLTWTTHVDADLGLSLDYPDDLIITKLKDSPISTEGLPPELIPDAGVLFATQPNAPLGVISVKSYDATGIATVEEWLEIRNEGRSILVTDGTTEIDGIRAVITHAAFTTSEGAVVNENKDETLVFFIRGPKLYEVRTMFRAHSPDHVRVWESIRFHEPPDVPQRESR